jgi:chromate transport protein ChrA
MASKQFEQLNELANLERLRLVRNWCLGLEFAACLIAIETIAGWGIGNPKNWASAYEAFAAAGELRWLFVPLIGIGIALFVVGIFLCIVVARRED